MREAENTKDDVWKITDEESDEEIAEKLYQLMGPSSGKARVVSKGASTHAAFTQGEA